MKDVVVLIPMLGRPEHIEPLLESLYLTKQDCRPLFLVSPHDIDVKDKISSIGEEMFEVSYRPRGDYARKINAGYRISKEPLIFLGASDLKFHDNWFENAVAQMNSNISVVGTNDLGNQRVIRGLHSTHSLLTREYADMGTVDESNTILHEGYVHEYVDDEFVETAKCRNSFSMAMNSIVEHMHPAWKKGKWDSSYKDADRRAEMGYKLYNRRRPSWTRLS